MSNIIATASKLHSFKERAHKHAEEIRKEKIEMEQKEKEKQNESHRLIQQRRSMSAKTRLQPSLISDTILDIPKAGATFRRSQSARRSPANEFGAIEDRNRELLLSFGNLTAAKGQQMPSDLNLTVKRRPRSGIGKTNRREVYADSFQEKDLCEQSHFYGKNGQKLYQNNPNFGRPILDAPLPASAEKETEKRVTSDQKDSSQTDSEAVAGKTEETILRKGKIAVLQSSWSNTLFADSDGKDGLVFDEKLGYFTEKVKQKRLSSKDTPIAKQMSQPLTSDTNLVKEHCPAAEEESKQAKHSLDEIIDSSNHTISKYNSMAFNSISSISTTPSSDREVCEAPEERESDAHLNEGEGLSSRPDSFASEGSRAHGQKETIEDLIVFDRKEFQETSELGEAYDTHEPNAESDDSDDRSDHIETQNELKDSFIDLNASYTTSVFKNRSEAGKKMTDVDLLPTEVIEAGMHFKRSDGGNNAWEVMQGMIGLDKSEPQRRAGGGRRGSVSYHRTARRASIALTALASLNQGKRVIPTYIENKSWKQGKSLEITKLSGADLTDITSISDIIIRHNGEEFSINRHFALEIPLLKPHVKPESTKGVDISGSDPNITIQALEMAFCAPFQDFNITHENCCSLLAVSRFFTFENILERCKGFMIDDIKAKNLLAYYAISDQYGLEEVRVSLFLWLSAHLESHFINNYSIAKIPYSLFYELCSSGKLFVANEFSFFTLLCCYVYASYHQDQEGTFMKISLDSFFRIASTSSGGVSFLSIEQYKKWLPLFDLVRLSNIHRQDEVQEIQTLNIFPPERLFPFYFSLIRALDSSGTIPGLTFEDGAYRIGVLITDKSIYPEIFYTLGHYWEVSVNRKRGGVVVGFRRIQPSHLSLKANQLMSNYVCISRARAATYSIGAYMKEEGRTEYMDIPLTTSTFDENSSHSDELEIEFVKYPVFVNIRLLLS
eukprot:Nk52_evm78s485 gene=Nk52_evmTU78s485